MQRIKLSFVFLTTWLTSLFASTAYADGINGNEGWHMMGGGGVMWLFWLIVIGVVVYLLVNVSKRQDSEPQETPLDILKKRYAQGDISKEDYERMKRDIQ